jgi:formylglycine-generating enzyme required for sulfatase activity
MVRGRGPFQLLRRADGSAWLQGGDPSQRMARGGSWDADPMLLSCATRYDCPSDRRSVSMGFRVARAVIQ